MDEDPDVQAALLRRVERAVAEAARIVASSEILHEVSKTSPGGRLTTRCAWCGRYRLAGRWVLVTRSGDDRLATTHGICPDCIAALRAAGLSH